MITKDMQGQFVCNGCRSVLPYPRRASHACCRICNYITAVPTPGASFGFFFSLFNGLISLHLSSLIYSPIADRLTHLSCAHCHTMLVYDPYGAPFLKCSTCHYMLNIAVYRLAHLSCAHCHTMLVYDPYGTPFLKCSACHYMINIALYRLAHLCCAHCHTMLLYDPYGAPLLKCSTCHCMINFEMNNMSAPIPAAHRPNVIQENPNNFYYDNSVQSDEHERPNSSCT
ncbi:hypothetical protein ZIOFF_065356 [Zingiber officinale]|uniref:Zinc finger LSD1-type domain-containing protein n=1 Tax=Zingiber officinale TaxID=94328 RepID=A0A8J5EX17_ZINOF|nr:hypothetical protein ZIOFF_065356 [Zingiber officinale]